MEDKSKLAAIAGVMAYLKEAEVEKLVIVGMQTHMCLEAATRAAHDLGFECVVVADACAEVAQKTDAGCDEIATQFQGIVESKRGEAKAVLDPKAKALEQALTRANSAAQALTRAEARKKALEIAEAGWGDGYDDDWDD